MAKNNIRPTGMRGRYIISIKGTQFGTCIVIIRDYFGETPAQVLEGQAMESVARVNKHI